MNYGHGDVRLIDIQLADFGSTVREDFAHARNGDPIGTPIFRSTEARLLKKWDVPTDIWSFGAIASLLPYYVKTDIQTLTVAYTTASQSSLWGRIPHLQTRSLC